MTVTTAIILDKRRMSKKTKNYPVVLRVTFNRDPRQYSLGIYLSAEDFEKLSSPRLGVKLREIKEKLEKEEQRAKTIIKNLRKFSFPAFSEEFFAYAAHARKRPAKNASPAPTDLKGGDADPGTDATPADRRNGIRRKNFKNQFGKRKYPPLKSEMDFRALGEVASHYGNYILKLEAQGRIGTVGCYMSSLMSLQDYLPQLRFSDITELELHRYETWMKEKGNSITTTSLYLRCLKRIFNLAINKKLIDRDLYPFGSERYVIPIGRNIKKAVPIDDIQRIYEYQSSDANKIMYRDFWLFIYLANGMNVKDVAMLKFKDIDGKFIRYIRSKTANTTRSNPQIISVYCSEDLQSIIERRGNADKSPDNYIFPVLSNGMDGYDKRHKIQLFTKLINTYMYEIGAELGITQKLSTMAARHSFSTQLKRSGVNIEAIRELLGHHNLKTTMSYLDSFEDASKVEQVANLLPFKKKPKEDDGEKGERA